MAHPPTRDHNEYCSVKTTRMYGGRRDNNRKDVLSVVPTAQSSKAMIGDSPVGQATKALQTLRVTCDETAIASAVCTNRQDRTGSPAEGVGTAFGAQYL